MHLVPPGAQRWGEVFELTGKILVKKEDFQSVGARRQVMRWSNPSRLTHTCHTTAMT